ncbi:ubiquinone/menaquinone biosynthesis C-methylase UbiE [Pelomonas saccharophila]|uniref:Ubiquinone/menaquinone biosynthesis C-methylase UbiE n=1 Tax=Roseateles saccharophilus TaxID=304 RepID=A0ABU1YNH7_ROSSA|nr:class I SAM-dependent methyltransferase [Roseateles saccharophilus]MDR7270409.1 ubiquinone/menaquinone biosynthesis C-methylase UbiE [Roseateles saccharophilus]
MNTTPITASPDYAAIKQRQQATWASGDYAVVGTTLQIVGEQLVEAADVRADELVLDVAAGNGNATLAAACRYARVTSTDYVGALLDKGRQRAEAEGLAVHFEVADVEALPFEAGSFDVVLSTFGVMFAPDHATSAREMLRVVRPGGRIALANWTPEGFIGQLFKTLGKHLPPPAGLRSPALWGSEAHITALFGPSASDLRVERKHFNFRYRSAEHFLQVFKTYYGPTHKAFAALGDEAGAALERDILALTKEHDIGGGRGLVVPSEYAEIVVTLA